ncbi:hypothetical protein Thermo_02007 [Thermoplasmatales archaeon]|nr:hypothetical protein Thermo_02007 [Thermoplasmatales archaeon]
MCGRETKNLKSYKTILFPIRGPKHYLLSKIPMDNLKSIVVDTPLINQHAIAFYEHSGFVKVNGLPERFSKNWTRMSKIV